MRVANESLMRALQEASLIFPYQLLLGTFKSFYLV